jgi:agmatinase
MVKRISTSTRNKSKYLFYGVADDSGTHSSRKGSSKGPDALRKEWNSQFIFCRKDGCHLVEPEKGIPEHIYDVGNIKHKDVTKSVDATLKSKKIPFLIGGDHSLTFKALKAINKHYKNVSLIYFDAHPDYVCSEKNYYGSVLCDTEKLKNIKLNKSFEIGNRSIETEEKNNLKTMISFSAQDVQEKGINYIWKKIKKTVTKNVYVSIDLDSLDPAYAPAVSTPVPGGLTSRELLWLVKKLSTLNPIGWDICELTPKYDIQGMTAHIAARIVREATVSKV